MFRGIRMKTASVNLLGAAGQFIMLPNKPEPWSPAAPSCVLTPLPERRVWRAMHLSRLEPAWRERA